MKHMQKNLAAALASLMLAVPAIAAEPQAGAEAAGEKPGLMAGAEATAIATVEAIDMDKRRVTLRRADGSLIDVVAGPEVRNLAQVEVGDHVVVQHKVGLVMMLSPAEAGDVRQRVDRVEAGRAELGEKPAGMVRKTVEATGTVMAVNRQDRTVTLQGARHTVTLPVAEDIDLGAFEVGDRVDAVYQESLAISVQPAPAEEEAPGEGDANP